MGAENAWLLSPYPCYLLCFAPLLLVRAGAMLPSLPVPKRYRSCRDPAVVAHSPAENFENGAAESVQATAPSLVHPA